AATTCRPEPVTISRAVIPLSTRAAGTTAVAADRFRPRIHPTALQAARASAARRYTTSVTESTAIVDGQGHPRPARDRGRDTDAGVRGDGDSGPCSHRAAHCPDRLDDDVGDSGRQEVDHSRPGGDARCLTAVEVDVRGLVPVALDPGFDVRRRSPAWAE